MKKHLFLLSIILIGIALAGCDDGLTSYIVTFDAQGGSPESTALVVESNGTIGTYPATPQKDNSFFAGWYTARNGGGSQFTETTTVTKDITVYANWSPTCTVTFDADGGTPPITTATVPAGESVQTLPSIPEKSGYAFNGWYTQKNGAGTLFTEALPLTTSITVYANWSTPVYTVIFDTDGGSPATISLPIASGGIVSQLPSAPTKPHNTFAGWWTEKDGGGAQFVPGTQINDNLTLYAKWLTTPQFKVNFDAQGGNPETSEIYVDYGAGVGSLPTPTREGYIFSNWWTQPEGAGSVFLSTTPIVDNITVYANWVSTDVYTVIFAANGGSPVATYRMVRYGETIDPLPAAPGREDPGGEDYIFAGWYYNSDGSGTEFTSATAVTQNTTLYAHWLLNTFTIKGASGSNPPLLYSYTDSKQQKINYLLLPGVSKIYVVVPKTDPSDIEPDWPEDTSDAESAILNPTEYALSGILSGPTAQWDNAQQTSIPSSDNYILLIFNGGRIFKAQGVTIGDDNYASVDFSDFYCLNSDFKISNTTAKNQQSQQILSGDCDVYVLDPQKADPSTYSAAQQAISDSDNVVAHGILYPQVGTVYWGDLQPGQQLLIPDGDYIILIFNNGKAFKASNVNIQSVFNVSTGTASSINKNTKSLDFSTTSADFNYGTPLSP